MVVILINYIEYLNLPTKLAIGIVALFLASQILGEILEIKGKVVPECIKLRKYFKHKKQERETLKQVPEMLKDVKETLNEFNSHYSVDNIKLRDEWIENVNHSLQENDKWIKELDKKLDKNNADTLSLLIDSKRNTIINFAEKVIDNNCMVTREKFNRVFKLYAEYEEIIEANGLTNGEVDIAYRIIKESYETHMRNHTFVEDALGYDVN